MILLPVGEHQRPWSRRELIPQEIGASLSERFRESREKKGCIGCHMWSPTHTQVEPLLPKVEKAATQTSRVLADGTH